MGTTCTSILRLRDVDDHSVHPYTVRLMLHSKPLMSMGLRSTTAKIYGVNNPIPCGAKYARQRYNGDYILHICAEKPAAARTSSNRIYSRSPAVYESVLP